VLTKQGVLDGSVTGGRDGLLEKSDGAVCVSAVKKHETRDTLVVRLYNQTGETATVIGKVVRGEHKVTYVGKLHYGTSD